MQYILNQPQTPLQLINWLKQHHEERMNQLEPFFKGATKYTSPLCVKTEKSILHHVAMVETALQSASSLEELQPDAIMFFPNYATLHAAFTIAKEKWTIEQAIEYIGAAKSSTYFYRLHTEDRLRLPKVDDVLYPYYHWHPTKILTDGYSVTSGHFPYLGSRGMPHLHPRRNYISSKIIQTHVIMLARYAAHLREEAEHLQVDLAKLLIPSYGVNVNDEDEDL